VNHLAITQRALTITIVVCALLAVSPLGAAAAPIESPGNLVGIDVSHWQGRIHWKSVRADGIEFAFAKATEGQTFVDGQYARNRSRTSALGIPFSAYHFARPDRTAYDAVREANHFVRTAQLAGHNLLPVLDLEATGGLGRRALVRWTKAWLARVEAHLGVKPMIYTSPSFWRDRMGNTTWFADHGYRVWIAHWRVNEPSVPAANWAGASWTFWQLSDCGKVAGIAGCVDVDLHRGLDIERLTIRANR
jgi:lysozyme